MSLVELNKVLIEKGKGKIENLYFNFTGDTISFKLKNKSQETTEIIFGKVDSFFFIESENNIEELEDINSISYYSSGFGEFSKAEYAYDESPVMSVPNFALDFKNSSIFIEAKSIFIDGKEYSLRTSLN